jgi:hypothetical protein
LSGSRGRLLRGPALLAATALPPERGSAQERFEQFCNQHPEPCGQR